MTPSKMAMADRPRARLESYRAWMASGTVIIGRTAASRRMRLASRYQATAKDTAAGKVSISVPMPKLYWMPGPPMNRKPLMAEDIVARAIAHMPTPLPATK